MAEPDRPATSRLGKMRPDLSLREQQVCNLVARGLTNREIADQMGISHWTIKTHVARILAKTNVRSRSQVAAVTRVRTVPEVVEILRNVRLDRAAPVYAVGTAEQLLQAGELRILDLLIAQIGAVNG